MNPLYETIDLFYISMNVLKTNLGFNDSPLSKTKKCVLVIGVRGSGKSTLVKKLENYLPIKLENYGVLDGDLIRTYSDLSGSYSDTKMYIQSIKTTILLDSINENRNIIVLDSGEKATYYYDLFIINGYKIMVVGVYVDNWEEVILRGRNRMINTGKPYTGTKDMWECSLDIITELMSKNISYGIIINNSDYNNPIIVKLN